MLDPVARARGDAFLNAAGDEIILLLTRGEFFVGEQPPGAVAPGTFEGYTDGIVAGPHPLKVRVASGGFGGRPIAGCCRRRGDRAQPDKS